jgi:hypothetical protein
VQPSAKRAIYSCVELEIYGTAHMHHEAIGQPAGESPRVGARSYLDVLTAFGGASDPCDLDGVDRHGHASQNFAIHAFDHWASDNGANELDWLALTGPAHDCIPIWVGILGWRAHHKEHCSNICSDSLGAGPEK